MRLYHNLSDIELTVLLKSSDRTAYRELYERYWSVLFHHARRLLQDEEGAKDIVQDVFIMLWNKQDHLESNSSPVPFLYTAVRNRILDVFKKYKVAEAHLLSLKNFAPQQTNTTDHLVREHELAAVIEAEIAQLPSRMREVFELKRKANLSYKEIAAEMNISELTVKTQMNKAIKVLKTKLGSALFSSAFPFL
ncbi:RNA polymerase sigma-70 factor [Pedobacter gandavensis]|uniref:RNA polymerase sigma factor n=1 Tax=Pedobacter gandavensis TaxID=2679963 RepID=UPI00293179F8|nr:RNA polymerase sigma-70 factor [Pedobacter gandavensis]